MILATTDAIAEVLRTWESDAKARQKLDPADQVARAIALIAEDIRRVLGETSPEWVSLSAVKQWTGWSAPTLRKRCREELEPRQLARKIGAGEWEVTMSEAVRWPHARRPVDVSRVEDLAELARIYGREE